MSVPPQLTPERLARLLDAAVSQVTPAPGTLERIHRGIRRRRWLRRFSAALLSTALLAGGSVTVLTMTPGGVLAGPQALPSPSVSAAAASPGSAASSVTGYAAGDAAAASGIMPDAADAPASQLTLRQVGLAPAAPDGDQPAATAAKVVSGMRKPVGVADN